MSIISAPDRAMRKIVNTKCESAEWAKTLSDVLSKMRNGFYDGKYIDILTQKFDMHGGYDIYDAYAFAMYHSYICVGQLARITLSVERAPYRDANINENNEVLNTVNENFEAVFWGGTQDADGYVQWRKPVWGYVADVDRGTVECVPISPGQVSLEVGYQSSAKSLMQINMHGLARWPYGHDEITVLINLKPRGYEQTH